MIEALKLFGQNVRGLMFTAGAAWVYVGIAAVSRPGADIFAGGVLMVVSAVPYLRPKRKD